MYLRDMENIVDPVQTAPMSSLIWVYTAFSALSVQKLKMQVMIIPYNYLNVYFYTYPLNIAFIMKIMFFLSFLVFV